MYFLVISENICIFRRPKSEGSLDLMPDMLETKGRLLKLIEDRLIFTNKSNEDFGYSISDESTCYVNGIVRKSKEVMSNNMKTIALSYLQYYADLEKTNFNWHIINEMIQNGISSLRKIQIKLMNFNNLDDLLNTVKDIIEKSAIPFDENVLSNVVNNFEFLEFLDEITHDAKINMSELVYVFESAISNLQDVLKWYRFIQNLYEELMEYEIQIQADNHLVEIDDILSLISIEDIDVILKLEKFLVDKLKIRLDLSELMHVWKNGFIASRMNQIHFIFTLILKRKVPRNCCISKMNVDILDKEDMKGISDEIKKSGYDFIFPIIQIISLHRTFANMGNTMKALADEIEEKTNDTDLIENRYEEALLSLKELRNIMSSSNDLHQILEALQNLCIASNLDIIPNISSSELSRYTRLWTQTLNDIIQYFEDSVKWYNFLSNLFVEMTSYRNQKMLSKYASQIEELNVNLLDESLDLQMVIQFFKLLGLEQMRFRNIYDFRDQRMKIKHLKQVRT